MAEESENESNSDWEDANDPNDPYAFLFKYSFISASQEEILKTAPYVGYGDAVHVAPDAHQHVSDQDVAPLPSSSKVDSCTVNRAVDIMDLGSDSESEVFLTLPSKHSGHDVSFSSRQNNAVVPATVLELEKGKEKVSEKNKIDVFEVFKVLTEDSDQAQNVPKTAAVLELEKGKGKISEEKKIDVFEVFKVLSGQSDQVENDPDAPVNLFELAKACGIKFP